MTALLAGLLLGIAGSGHCAAMCGPLLLALRANTRDTGRFGSVLEGLWYQTGRLAMYALLGFLAGLAGQAAALGGLGRALAIGAGVLLLASAGWRLGARGIAPQSKMSIGVARLLAAAARWMRGRPLGGPLIVGALNGLLPCGMVYGAVTAAAGFGSPREAVLFMLAFGAGTLPPLMAIWLAAAALPSSARRRLRLVAPVALAVVGVLLIARGIVRPLDADRGAPAHHVHMRQ